ncbi:MAG TPA: pyruvate, phosphate dikinase [Candidatus Krumholzibacteria bacterium]|nr:pyruvate, phosphate dikinase [Candidatus Krumholzibacteria bacterium]HPD71250.1 pyruvate, phosphate dikinase [Candidatus Krumholzibacteria bacterium]HRY39050.1 pyruvate, phosphate dikinase [Candidatus Krumholzibacteria bacterium]
MSEKRVYFFGDGQADGQAELKNLLGGKGANLAEMTRLGIPVPPGFTITTAECTIYQQTGAMSEALKAEVRQAMARVEAVMRKTFADPADPLLFSVRSGARVSMPGMMDTVLNLGLNERTVAGLAKKTGNERFAYDSYRRLIHMYGDVVMGVDSEHFEEAIDALKARRRVKLDTDLDAGDLRELCAAYLDIVARQSGRPFPDDPWEQLWGGVVAVFRSWGVPRAVEYRRIHRIPEDWGTAVNVQAMVYGNLGQTSATGVAFTRDPSTGENRFYGEFLVNAQGEDVVAGIRTPQQINRAGRDSLPASHEARTLPTMEEVMPALYGELAAIRDRLERHYRNMQDIEFTIQENRLWMLQTRNGKRTGMAAIRIACDLEREGLVDAKRALLLVEPDHLDQLLHDQIDPKARLDILASGLPASPGAAQGAIMFNAEDAVAAANRGQRVVLVRRETSPEDIAGMNKAQGILTSRGGMTSHAAVVARGMGKPCVAGCGDVQVDAAKKLMTVAGRQFREGDTITLDGTTGAVIAGAPALVPPSLDDPNLSRLMGWADRFRRLKVRTNADTPHDARQARKFGAQGIGLCRTEHMFFGEDRIRRMRQMILAGDETARRAALEHIRPLQQADFEGIFAAMDGLPVTVRLLDPPLHEFLPQGAREIEELAGDLGVSVADIERKVEALHEQNPMLGHRGCRLGLTFPEIYEVQVEAIIGAALVQRSRGVDVRPEIMIPLVGARRELVEMRKLCVETAARVMAAKGAEVAYLVGTMIEVPRAALTADQIAEAADFFSFGTNDLTQMTFGFSRDDIATFLPVYLAKGLLPTDPFQQLDQTGVGQLVEMAVAKGRAVNPQLHLGICGEHGGDPASIGFCHRVGLDYVSCSPFRVPIARLAAAQIAIREELGG